MKSLLRVSALTTLGLGLHTSAFSQVWLESRTVTDMTFVIRAASGTMAGAKAVTANEYNSGAGARFNLSFNSTLRTITVNVTNLSDSDDSGVRSQTVGILGSSVDFNNGRLLGFGFELNPTAMTLNTGTSTGTANAAFNLPGDAVADTDVPNTFYSPLTFTHAPAYNVDAGVYWNGSSADRLDAGKGATYVFRFDAAGFNSSTFNTTSFWTGNAAAAVDFSVVFNKTENSQDWDKVAVSFDNLPIPEPSTYGLIGAGALVAMVAYRRRRSATAK